MTQSPHPGPHHPALTHNAPMPQPTTPAFISPHTPPPSPHP